MLILRACVHTYSSLEWFTSLIFSIRVWQDALPHVCHSWQWSLLGFHATEKKMFMAVTELLSSTHAPLKDLLASCKDNVTDLSLSDSLSERGDGGNAVKTFICQSTVIPASGRGFNTALTSQSINLADTFLGEQQRTPWPWFTCSNLMSCGTGATVESTLAGIKARPDLYPHSSRKVPDVHFYFR